MTSILVIEDDPSILDNLIDLLEGEGHHVFAAQNGFEGIRIAQNEIPNLIISDVMMPEMDGYDVLAALKQDPTTATIPFIFLTALADQTEQRRGMNHGADDYLTKPFKADDVMKAVHARLDKQARHHRTFEERLRELGRNISRVIPHEFRTPLGVIIGYAQMISEEADLFQMTEIRDMMRDVYVAGERLEELAEKYTVLAEIEVLQTDPEKFASLKNTYIENAIDLLRTIAEKEAQKHNRLADLVLDLTPTAVRINPDHFRILIHELLENAFKFSSEDTPVLLTARENSAGDYILEFRDNGRGMRKAHIEQINAFMQFERESYEQQGLGIGLYIAKRIVELYDGTLVLDSALKQGTCARVVLPIVINEAITQELLTM
ncbi:MAG: response regulator [Rhodothermales bacterium]